LVEAISPSLPVLEQWRRCNHTSRSLVQLFTGRAKGGWLSRRDIKRLQNMFITRLAEAQEQLKDFYLNYMNETKSGHRMQITELENLESQKSLITLLSELAEQPREIWV